MGRRIPANDIQLNHPVLSFTLLAAGMAAAIAIITGMCGVRCRRKSSSSQPPPPPPSSSRAKKTAAFAPTPPTPTASEPVESEENEGKELPLPPATKRTRESGSCRNMVKSLSDRTMTARLSTKVTRSLSMARNGEQIWKGEMNNSENGRKKGKKVKTDQESIWMKTIILGEKCRVDPDEEEEGGAIIYEGKGKKISAYHPRTSSSLSTISRHSSFIDQESIPTYQHRN